MRHSPSANPACQSASVSSPTPWSSRWKYSQSKQQRVMWGSVVEELRCRNSVLLSADHTRGGRIMGQNRGEIRALDRMDRIHFSLSLTL